MTSPKQFEASGQNGILSADPRSEPGKDVSRKNALTHGLTVKQIVIKGCDPKDIDKVANDGVVQLGDDL